MTNDFKPQQEHFIKIRVLHWTALMNYVEQQIIQLPLLIKNFTSQNQFKTLKFGRMQRVKFIA